MKSKVGIVVLAGLLLAAVGLWVSLSAAPEHDPGDLRYWSHAGGTNDWSAAAVQGNARAQFFYGFGLIRMNLEMMVNRVPGFASIPIIGRRYFQTVSYRIDDGISQEELAKAYRWIRQSSEQGFAPAKEAEKLFRGRIAVTNQVTRL